MVCLITGFYWLYWPITYRHSVALCVPSDLALNQTLMCMHLWKACVAQCLCGAVIGENCHLVSWGVPTSPTEMDRVWTIFSCAMATTLWPFISMILCPTRTPPLSAIPPRIRLQIWGSKITPNVELHHKYQHSQSTRGYVVNINIFLACTRVAFMVHSSQFLIYLGPGAAAQKLSEQNDAWAFGSQQLFVHTLTSLLLFLT